MKKTTSTRIILFVALIALLGLPTSILPAHARQQEQQEGPTKPSPTPQPGAAPKAPTGQQQPASAGPAGKQAEKADQRTSVHHSDNRHRHHEGR